MFDVKQLEAVELLDPRGESIPLGGLWRDRSVVLALVRHFG